MVDHKAHRELLITFLNEAQRAYAERRLEEYLSAFAKGYSAPVAGSAATEGFAELARRISKDMSRYEVVRMDFDLKQIWLAERVGFARAAYRTTLRPREGGADVFDERENLIIAEFDDHDRWQIVCKFQLTSLTAP